MIRKAVQRNFRGSFRDPLLYLGCIALFLFGFASLGASALLSSYSGSLPSFLQSPQDSSGLDNNPFLDQEGAGKFAPPPFSIFQNNSFLGVSTPLNISPQVLGAIGGEVPEEDIKEQRDSIIEYIVEAGDTPASLAEKFDISLNTILWANDLSSNSKLKVGQKLVILPVSGLIHHVKSRETTSEIAEVYQAKAEEIIFYNDLSDNGSIVVGDILVVPDGKMPSKPKYTSYTSAPAQVPVALSYFICPIASPCTVSQGLHWYNAIDFTHGKCGEPIYAAAQGQVLKVKYGWNGGAGNYISILHPNGVVTLYGHLATMLVSPGQNVSQGQQIATMGGKPGSAGAGISTGCHVHFDVRGAKNPFAR